MFSAKQLSVIRDTTASVILADGSIRSGKTLATATRWLHEINTSKNDGLLVMTGRTIDTLHRNIITPLTALAPHAAHARKHASTAEIMGKTVHLIGMNDAQAESKIRGMTIEKWYADEASTYPEEAFTQMLGRQSVPHPIALITTNPESRAHWFKRRYIDRLPELPHWSRYRFTMDDNPGLTPEYIAARKAEFTGVFYDRMILGKWVSAEGLIYDAFNPAVHVIPATDMPPISRVIATGLDYGTTNPTRAVTLALTAEQPPRLAITSEFAHNPGNGSRKLTDAEQSRALREWFTLNSDDTGWVIIDPAAASLRQQLHADGVQRLTPAKNTVIDGIRTVASLFATNQLIIADTCTNLIDELETYTWDSKATDRGLDSPVKQADHSVDALRYAIFTTRSNWQRHLTETT